MIRVLVYLLLLAALAYGGVLLVQNPGHVTLTWFGEVVDAPAALIIGAIALAAIVGWSILRFVFGFPSLVKLAARQRRREKGYQALSRGLIAVGSGDGRSAGRAASQASRHLKDDPLAIMLRAQAAHMNGEGYVASAAFEELAQRQDTRVLGLRGLHAEAARRGDEEAARHFAAAAHDAAPLPWSAQAVLEHRASSGDWERALATVESSLAARLIEKDVGERQRAVLETAIAYDKEMVDPDAALVLARAAIKRAPDLAPPVVLAARLLSRRGDIRKASKLIERAWPRCQHPDIADAYLDVRPGDSTQDRLARAKTLMGIATFDPVSRTTVARAALANRDFETTREAMAPLVAEGKRPTVRQCLLMAELEEAEHGDDGLWREWVARASRAPLDPAWICDGTVYDHWAPASPKTGQLDAFYWQVPAERLGPAIDALPVPRRRPPASLPTPPTAALVHHEVEPAASVAPTVELPVPPAGNLSEPSAAAAAAVSVHEATAPSVVTQISPVAPDPTPAPDPATSATTITARPSDPPDERVAPWQSAERTKAPLFETPPPDARPNEGLPAPATSAGVDIKQVKAEIASSIATVAAPKTEAVVAPPPADHPETAGALPEPHRTSVNPRIHLPPDIEAAERRPESPRTLFHRRVAPDAEPAAPDADAGPSEAPTTADAPRRSAPRRTDVTQAGSHAADAAGPDGPVSPNPRISLPLETVAEERNPAAPRALFHRRLTPNAEAHAEQIAATTSGNGASRDHANGLDRSAAARGNGGSRPKSPGATAVKPG